MALDFELFHDPTFGGEGIAMSWLQDAQGRGRGAFDAFSRFNSLWAAFNAWGMCVTLDRTDSKMLISLASDRRLQGIFLHHALKPSFRRKIQQIQDNFPLSSFSDLLRLDANFNWRGERDAAYWAKIASAPRNKHVRTSPPLSADVPDLSQFLHCVYKVRCNLVHGGKRADENEARFVSVFADLLEQLMCDGEQCFLGIRYNK